MDIHIISVGKARKGPEKDLYDSFVTRIAWPIGLVEVEERRPSSAAERVGREGALLQDRIPDGAVVIALDGRGREVSSEDFATRLGRWRDGGCRHIAFVIGGADGLDPAITKTADLVLSLGPMTWPHLMVRAMVAEQVYRAQEILAGHPYHRAGPPPQTAKKGGKQR